MKNLIVIGTGGFSLDVCWLAERTKKFSVVGILDLSYADGIRESHGFPILGNTEDWPKFEDCEFIIAIGSPIARKRAYNEMLSVKKAPHFATLIDPQAIVGPSVKIGEGSIICAGSVMTTGIIMGNHCILNVNSTIAHECAVGSFVTFAPMVGVSGRCKIHDGVEIGTGSVIRQNLEVGENSVLGMGGVLTKNMPPNTLFYGNPAKYIRDTK